MLSEAILGYKSSWRILNLLLETPRKPVSRKELFQYTKLGNAPLSKGLDRLTAAALIILEKRGKKEFYYLNERNEFIYFIKGMWEKERKNLRNVPYEITLVLSEFVRSVQESNLDLTKIILFGSQAKGTASQHSDIDLALVFSDDLKEEIIVTKTVQKLEKQFKVKIQVHFLTLSSFNQKNNLIDYIKNEGISLLP